jgi:hypothetical protein
MNEVWIYEMSRDVSNFLMKRCEDRGIGTKINVIVGDGASIVFSQNFDKIIWLQSIERHPQKADIIKSVYQKLENNGELILSFRNIWSYYGVYYFLKRRKELDNQGPFRPVNFLNVIDILKANKFYCEEINGLGLTPKFLKNRILRGLLKYFCRIGIIRSKKRGS